MRYIRLAAIALLLAPSVAFGAGFAKQSLFLSKSPVTEGESVLIHTVVQNDAATAFSGSLVVFAQNGSAAKEKIGTVAVTIAAQGANTVSVSWKPGAGQYAVTAELTQQDGTVVETESANFTINEKPKPATQQSDLLSQIDTQVQSSADVQAMINKFVPAVSGVTTPVFGAIDAGRIKAGALLDAGLNWSKSKAGAKPEGVVLGASTQNTSPQGLLGTGIFIAATAGVYFFSVLKWIVANTGIFYPLLAFAILYALWRVFARMRRPSY